jgi:glycine cleavage system aminomethyltransferase T
MRDGGKSGVRDIGFTAQDLMQVEDALNAHDELRLTYRSNPDALEASYGRLIPVLVKAIQELSSEIQELKAAA